MALLIGVSLARLVLALTMYRRWGRTHVAATYTPEDLRPRCPSRPRVPIVPLSMALPWERAFWRKRTKKRGRHG